jgi:hypothetical protein
VIFGNIWLEYFRGREELVGESIGKLAEFVHFKRKLLGQMEEEAKFVEIKKKIVGNG